jgi:hypothetical protein
MVLPTAWNSWTLVDTICSDSNAARKQISRNMKVLGATQCKNLTPAPVRTAPTAADLKISVFGEKKKAATKLTDETSLRGAKQCQCNAQGVAHAGMHAQAY